MKYADFISDSLHAIRSQAPTVDDAQRLHRWLVSIGELLNSIRHDMEQRRYEEYCISLLIALYKVSPMAAGACIRHAKNEAKAGWPKVANL